MPTIFIILSRAEYSISSLDECFDMFSNGDSNMVKPCGELSKRGFVCFTRFDLELANCEVGQTVSQETVEAFSRMKVCEAQNGCCIEGVHFEVSVSTMVINPENHRLETMTIILCPLQECRNNR